MVRDTKGNFLQDFTSFIIVSGLLLHFHSLSLFSFSHEPFLSGESDEGNEGSEEGKGKGEDNREPINIR